ncbi:MAG: hypothetical protein ACM3X6_02835 [Patescibacteria group bacterium]
MFRIRNVTHGPLSIDLTAGRSLHLLPQAEERISDADAGTAQVRALARRGHVRLTQEPVRRTKAGGENSE